MTATDNEKATATTADGLQNVVAGLGTSRDKMSYGEYGQVLSLDRVRLENMYRGSWLAGKIVDVPADDMTRAWRCFAFDDMDAAKDTLFTLEDAERKHRIKAKVNEALKWARLFGGAALVLGVGSNRDKRSYEEPLDPTKVKQGDLKFVHVFDKNLLSPSGDIEQDIESENFMQPVFYTLNGATRIHHSRVIKFIGRPLPYYSRQAQSWWGDSELQRTYDALLGKDTTTAAIATMLFEANVDVIQSQGLADLLTTKGGEQQVTKRFQVAALMKSFNRLLLLDGNEVYDKKSNNFANLDAILREFRAEVAGASDIPVTRLFGTSATGLNANGDNDVRNYYDKISSDQEAWLRPALEKLDDVLVRSALGKMPDDYKFSFKSLWQMSDLEKSTMQKNRADRDKVYWEMGAIGVGSIAKQLKEDGTYSTMTTDDVKLAEELDKSMENEGDAGNGDQPQGGDDN